MRLSIVEFKTLVTFKTVLAFIFYLVVRLVVLSSSPGI